MQTFLVNETDVPPMIWYFWPSKKEMMRSDTQIKCLLDKCQGLELRMLVKIQIQNLNDLALDFSGVAVKIDVQGKCFATGVSDVGGSVPRFGETIDVQRCASGLRCHDQKIPRKARV